MVNYHKNHPSLPSSSKLFLNLFRYDIYDRRNIKVKKSRPLCGWVFYCDGDSDDDGHTVNDGDDDDTVSDDFGEGKSDKDQLENGDKANEISVQMTLSTCL